MFYVGLLKQIHKIQSIEKVKIYNQDQNRKLHIE